MTPRVLVVDDDDAIRRSIAATLARSGFDVATANDGDPALRIAEVATPYVAVLTGADDATTRDICREAGADAVLIKPISPNELRRVLTAAAIALDATPAA